MLGAVVAATAVAKLSLLSAGPEFDPDAYAHAMAGRRMLENATDVRVHWVWLPLWHLVHGLAARFGSGTYTVRALNVALTSAAPLMLAAMLARWLRPARQAQLSGQLLNVVPWLAGVLLALAPTGVVLGSTSQMEPPVMVLLLGACWGWESLAHERAKGVGRAALVGVLLAAAALIRYETWLLLPLFVLLWLRSGRGWQRTPAWLLPCAAVVGWCVLHRVQTGEWFQFLRFNAEFAGGYLQGVGYPWGGEPNALLMAVWYVVVVPFHEHHLLTPLTLLGMYGFVRRAPRTLVGVQLTVLAALTVGWIARQHLGLPRHALTLAPLYATGLALGTVTVARWVHTATGAWTARRTLRRWAGSAAIAVAIAVALAAVRTVPRYLGTVAWHAITYRDSYDVARALRDLSRSDDQVFCDYSTVEVLSNLDPARFTRWHMRDVEVFHLARATRAGGRSLVVSDRVSTRHLRRVTRTLYAAGELVILVFEPATEAVAHNTDSE